MKRFVILWLVLSSVGLTASNGEPYLSMNDAGLQRKLGLLVYGQALFTGYTYDLFPSGAIKEKTHWVNGKRDGRYTRFFENGNLKEVRFYKNHLKDSIHQGWHANGTLHFEYHFLEGQYHGSFKEWYPDGSLYTQRNYAYGQEVGTQQVFEEDGSIRANYFVKDGYRYGLTGSKNCITTPDLQP
jgi:antitoxin component YwqK of YwqJK toxin-antitoxin module